MSRAEYQNRGSLPSGVSVTVVGGRRVDRVAEALRRVIARTGAIADHEQLHRDAARFGYCLLDAAGRRVSPEVPAGATQAITSALGRE